jgi:hypothetical protein
VPSEGEVEMGVLALIVEAIGFFVAGFVSWYTLWHRRMRHAFEKVPVAHGRTAYVLRRGVVLEGRRH